MHQIYSIHTWYSGVAFGPKLMMTGSTMTEVESVLNAHDLPGLAPMEHDLLRAQERATPPQAQQPALPAGTLFLPAMAGEPAEAIPCVCLCHVDCKGVPRVCRT